MLSGHLDSCDGSQSSLEACQKGLGTRAELGGGEGERLKRRW